MGILIKLGFEKTHKKKCKFSCEQPKLIKLGFHPESFTQPSFAKDDAFLDSHQRSGVVGKVGRTMNNPLTWALGGASLFLSHKKRSNNPESIWPYLTGGLLVIVSITRWHNASKKDKQNFVKEYNAVMGTTFTVDHPKMQALWNLTNARANRIERFGKYNG